MHRLQQKLDVTDDSFTYTLLGEIEPLYRVDSEGYLHKAGEIIGKFKLANNQWDLYISDILFMSSPANQLFYLPEFELKALTALVNQKRPSAL